MNMMNDCYYSFKPLKQITMDLFFYALLIVALLVQTYRVYALKESSKYTQEVLTDKDHSLAVAAKESAMQRTRLTESSDLIAGLDLQTRMYEKKVNELNLIISDYASHTTTYVKADPLRKPHPVAPADISKKSFNRDAKGHFRK